MLEVRAPASHEAHGQPSYAVRLEWGPTGAAAIAAGADVAVVVDVLSFTTTLSVALDRGMTVYPYRWRDDGAAAYAADREAVLAVGRFEADDGTDPATSRVTLSPAAMQRVSGVRRIVLPSPNGSSISFGLAGTGATVVGACLRNRSAVARWLAPRVAAGAVVALVPAGERWPDGSLRPGLEDLWGAGAVLAALLDMLPTPLRARFSPEARQAASAFEAVRATLSAELHACAGGQELAVAGFADDVAVAADLDASEVVPVLRGEAFVEASSRVD